MRIIILAAGQGTRLRPLTEHQPKCLVELDGQPLLDWQIQTAHEAGITDLVVVGGYCAEKLPPRGARVITNANYATTNMVSSLFCAEEFFGNEFIVSYGDIVYSVAVLRALAECRAPVGVVVDLDWFHYWSLRFDDPLSDAESLRFDETGTLQSIGQKETDVSRIQAQFIGLMAFRGEGVRWVRQIYASARAEADMGRPPFGTGRPLSALFMTDFLQGMIHLGFPVTAVPVRGGWCEIDSLSDLKVASDLVASGRLAARQSVRQR